MLREMLTATCLVLLAGCGARAGVLSQSEGEGHSKEGSEEDSDEEGNDNESANFVSDEPLAPRSNPTIRDTDAEDAEGSSESDGDGAQSSSGDSSTESDVTQDADGEDDEAPAVDQEGAAEACGRHCDELAERVCEADDFSAADCAETCLGGRTQECSELRLVVFECLADTESLVCRDNGQTVLRCEPCLEQLTELADTCNLEIECVVR